MIDYKKYFNILCWSINPDYRSIPDTKGMDWFAFYRFTCEQAIAGVAFEGVKRMSDAREKVEENHQPLESEHQSKPPFSLLMEWIGLTEQIAGQNRLVNKKCLEVQKELHESGFDNCIIKGQGNALNYPNPYSRTSGDIDIIIRNADRKRLTQWVKEHKGLAGCHFQHAEYEEDGVGVELHFVPCYMNNPIYHKRLQKWLHEQAEKDDIWNHEVGMPDGMGRITIPSSFYNLIYQLAHIMHHFFDEGIGLRQMMDYYLVLMEEGRRQMEEGRRQMEEGRGKMDDVADTLQYLGLWKFAGAVMYVMQEVFHLDKAYMLAPVDERRGKTLMEEILKGGNFGRYSGLTNHTAGGKYVAKTLRNFRLVREYPAEALCEPVFRTWHFLWRQWHKYV